MTASLMPVWWQVLREQGRLVARGENVLIRRRFGRGYPVTASLEVRQMHGPLKCCLIYVTREILSPGAKTPT